MRTSEVTRTRRWIIPRLALEFTAREYAALSTCVTPFQALARLRGLWYQGRLEVYAPIGAHHTMHWCAYRQARADFRPTENTKWRRAGRWVCVITFRRGLALFGAEVNFGHALDAPSGLPDDRIEAITKEVSHAAKQAVNS